MEEWMESTDEKFSLEHIVYDLQRLVADIIYIHFRLSEVYVHRLPTPNFEDNFEDFLPFLSNQMRQNKINIRITFLLYGICIEDVCRKLKPYLQVKMKKYSVPEFLSSKNYDEKSEILKIYHMYNVFKHGSGIIDINERSGKKLVDNYPMRNHQDLSDYINNNALVSYSADVYKGLEKLILCFGAIKEEFLINGVDKLDICLKLSIKAKHIK